MNNNIILNMDNKTINSLNYENNIEYILNKSFDLFSKGDLNGLKKELDKIDDNTNIRNALLLKGILNLNLKNYSLSSHFFWKILEYNICDKQIWNNLNYLPSLYQDKKFTILLEGYYNIQHSFSIVMESFIQSLFLIPNIELYYKSSSLDILNKQHLDNSIYDKIKKFDIHNNNNNNHKFDLTIRIKFPFDFSPCIYSKKTLVFFVLETLTTPIEIKNISNNVYLMTPSNYSKNIFMEKFKNINDDSLYVIPHGINYNNYKILDENQKNFIKEKYKIPFDCEVFLNISSGLKSKNLIPIIKQFKKYYQINKNIFLVLKINTKLYNLPFIKELKYLIYNQSSLNQNFDNNHVIDNILLIDDVFTDEQINQLYNICDCYISPYSAEGFNLPVLEALSYGKKIIATNGGICDEYLYGKNIYKIKSFKNEYGFLEIDEESLYENIKNCSENKQTLEEEFDKIKYVMNNYNLKTITNNMIDIYLRGPFYVENIIKIINFYEKQKISLNNIINIDEFDKNNIKNYLIKLSNIKDVQIKIDNNMIDKLKYFHMYNTVYDNFINKNNLNKSQLLYLFFNQYENIKNLKIHPIYKSLIISNIMLNTEIISRNKYVYNNIVDFFNNYSLEEYLCLLPTLYFNSTYISNTISSKIKSQINKNIQNLWKKNNIEIINKPIKNKIGKYKIAIFGTIGDFTKNPVYKFIYSQLKTLSCIFELDIFILEKSDSIINDDLKKITNNIYNIYFKESSVSFFQDLYENKINSEFLINNIQNFDKIINNSYMACYFLVIGCETLSIYLSNLQIAPIQFGGYGHPISSFGSKNNYFIISDMIENMDKININYTENPILCNYLTTKPIVSLVGDINFNQKNKFEILLSCTFKKLTPQFMNLLEKIAIKIKNKFNTKVKYHFFTGPCAFLMDSYFLTNEIVKNDNYEHEIHLSNKDYNSYMITKSKCYIAFDSYHYAGFTTILENIYLKIPTIVWKGDEVVNRFPYYIYKLLDLEELIVENEEQYIEKAIFYLENDTEYDKIYNKLKSFDYNNFIEKNNYEESLIQSIKNIILNNNFEL